MIGSRRVLVLGGARSGKSRHAEQLLRRARAVEYVACGPLPRDEDAEWAQRVALHRARRPAHWVTTETDDLTTALRRAGPPALIDCLATWLTSTMDRSGVWDGRPGADAALAAAVDDVVADWATARRQVIAVSNEVGSGVVPATSSGRRFRDELGALNTRIASLSDRVWLVTAGIARRLK